jgi:deferrochelatase/peroxidase EfeB
MDGISRRHFLQAGAVAGAVALGGVTSKGAPAAVGAGDNAGDTAGADTYAPFHGTHQAGILAPAAPTAAVLAFDVIAGSADELADLLRTLTDRARRLTAGGPPENLGPVQPPDDNGILGPIIPAQQLTVTLGLGASLFDDRFGLADHKPARLTPMATFPNDHLDPARTHGDLSILLQAASFDTVVHAMRDITKHTRGAMQPRWRVDGFTNPPRPSGTQRNFLGFKDGIANPDVKRQAIVDSLIWVPSGAPEPVWAAGGTYQVIRIIRMLVEFWDRVSLQEQETMFGRRKDSGAPLDANSEFDIPNYAADPAGNVIPLTAHIRLANPRTPETAPSQILRRGFNYDRGLDVNGNLDQGLVFTCYQQDIERQFAAVQTRLIGEPLVDYVSPVGGGYFFVPPGVAGPDDFYGRPLFT